jgi:SAM-dependent methyltransferase
VIPQREFWRGESWRYFERNYGGRDLRALPPHPHLAALLERVPLALEAPALLDLGCGPANNLHHLAARFGARRAVGVEASPATVAALARAFPAYAFVASDGVALPFPSATFDLVLLRGVLCWIDRDYVLQTLGEALRVAARWLVVSDFAPLARYSTVYHHDGRYRTYKQSYQPLLEATGLVRAVAGFYADDGDEWSCVQTVLYRKLALDDAFPVRGEGDVRGHGG